MLQRALLLAVLIASSLAQANAQSQVDWLDKIAGQYRGQLRDGDGVKPVLTTLYRRSVVAQLGGEYLFGDERVPGKLQACSPVGPLALRCVWVDKFGKGTLELTFDDTLTAFEGRWPHERAPQLWFPWNGRVTPNM